MLRLLYLSMVFFCLLSCGNKQKKTAEAYIPKAPNYTQQDAWYSQDKGRTVDVFYILPTCIFDWEPKESGKMCHHYDVYQQVMKQNFDYSLQLANDIFADSCNFYAPYYRQISLESWLQPEDVIEARFSIAMKDVKQAFTYYLNHLNHGKDFILAGYSQGAKGVVELVKSLDKETFSRMKAAYVIGYRITEEDLRNPNIKPAQNDLDHGTMICFNSVRSAENIWPAISKNNQVCINPVNWKTDETCATLNDSISVHIDDAHKVLIVEGYNGDDIEIPVLKGHLPKGNFHLSELTLFHDCLERNVLDRIR